MIVLDSICEAAHITSTKIINAVVLDDQTVDGYTGSSADFCDVCGSSVMTPLGARFVEGTPSK